MFMDIFGTLSILEVVCYKENGSLMMNAISSGSIKKGSEFYFFLKISECFFKGGTLD